MNLCLCKSLLGMKPTVFINHTKNCGSTTYIYCDYLLGSLFLTLKVLVTTIDAQLEGMGDVGLARYEPALLPPCPTISVLSYSN